MTMLCGLRIILNDFSNFVRLSEVLNITYKIAERLKLVIVAQL